MMMARFAAAQQVQREAAPAPGLVLDPIEVEAAREAETREESATSFVTVVPVDAPSARVGSVADLVEREAGVRVRSAGGPGSFTSISIRGGTSTEVAVYLDGVPLNRAAAGSVDLSQIPLEGLSRIEIYRGLAPPELGGQAVGGAINLISKRGGGPGGSGLRLSIGGGSFATRSASAGHGYAAPGLRSDVSIAYRGSRADFLYYDDNGTLLATGDDHPSLRRNNDFDQLSADVSLQAGTRIRTHLGVHTFMKDQGVAGRAGSGANALHARLATGRVLVESGVERSDLFAPGSDARLGAHLLLERTAFNNREGELVGTNGAARTDGETWAGGVDGRIRVPAGTRELWTLLASIALERFSPSDLLRPERSAPASQRARASLTIADEIALFSDRLLLSPAVRFEGVVNQLAPGQSVIAMQAAGSSTMDAYLTPQVAARIQVAPWLAIKAGAGRYVRLPTTFELFGDGAFLLPRPSLRAETGYSAEAGATLDLDPRMRRGPLAFSLETALFGRSVSDFIAILPSSRAASAENVGDERFFGAELRARLRVRDFLRLAADYTFIRSIDDAASAFPGSEGKRIPGVPDHKLDARADLALGPFTISYEASYLSEVWLNAQNLPGNVIPARTLHALAFKAGPFPSLPIVLGVEIRNLGDLRVVPLALATGGGVTTVPITVPTPLVDYMDYPLPGRSLFVTLSLQPRTNRKDPP